MAGGRGGPTTQPCAMVCNPEEQSGQVVLPACLVDDRGGLDCKIALLFREGVLRLPGPVDGCSGQALPDCERRQRRLCKSSTFSGPEKTLLSSFGRIPTIATMVPCPDAFPTSPYTRARPALCPVPGGSVACIPAAPWPCRCWPRNGLLRLSLMVRS